MAQPSPEIRQRLAQLRAEAQIRAERDAQRQKAAQNAEKVAGQPVGLPTDKKAKGGLETFLKDSKVKSRMYHATPKDFSEFDETKPTFVTHDPEWASKWALTDKSMGLKSPPWVLGNPRPWQVMPVYAQAMNPFDYENPEHLSALGKLLDIKHVESLNNTNNWRQMERGEVIGAIKKLGHDSFYVSEKGTKNLGVFDSRKIKSAIGNRGTFDTKHKDITKAKGGSVMGINVASDRKAGLNYADLIVDGYKTLESRNTDSLRPYVGKRVAIVRTGHGPAKAIGEVTIGEPMVVNKKKFRSLERQHMVPEGSAFDISTPTKHLYPLSNPQRYEQEHDVGHGIVARKVMHKAIGGEVEEDYRGGHTAPGPHFGAPMHDVTRDMYPKDFYGPNGFRYYADFGEQKDRDAYNKVTRVKGKPDEMVAIHRAIPTKVYNEALKKDVPLKHMIRPGDWVAIHKDYAKEHGESVLLGDYKIASMRVPAKHVWTNGDSIHEWGYHPVEKKATGGSIPSQDVMRLAIGGQGPRNFLKGSVEKVIDPLKKQGYWNQPELYLKASQNPLIGPATKAQLEEAYKDSLHHHSINNWIERNLGNYIRKQLGHPNDPLRKLAEEGVLHFNPDTAFEEDATAEQAESRRQMMGGQKMAKGPLAQAWENAVDSTFEPNTVEDVRSMPDIYQNMYEPWMDKADPKTQLYELYGANELGFDHIVDILKQDLAEGRIRPEQLNKVSIEQAVRRVHEYDQAQKKKMSETALKATEGMPVHKDYGNGFKWIELAMPDPGTEVPDTHELEQYNSNVHGTGYRYVNKQTGMKGEGYKTPERATEEFLRSQAEDKLDKALKYEGDTMGHCVGGYTPDVASGKSRIFSLRDEKNEPHVTVEVQPKNTYISDKKILDLMEQNYNVEEMSDEEYKALHGRLKKEALANQPLSIKQIKGKGNAKPKKDYIPYVQDFVKSGNWSDVGDLNNTDLRKIGNKYLSDDELDALSRQHLGTVINNPARYYSDMKRKDPSTISEADQNYINAIEQHGNQPKMADGGEVDAEAVFMAKGGKVSSEPKKTVKAYKLFRVDERNPGKLFPLFVNANQPVEMNKWVDAEVGPQTDKGKVKSKLGPLAYRPGWHSGDLPVATHIGAGGAPPTHRPKNHAWAEVEVPDDVDWQTEANKRGTNPQGKLVPVKAHITDQIPKGGHYRYKTNPNMTGNWLISGSMKVNKVLSQAEVDRINKKAGVSDLPRKEPFNKKEFGFKHGGEVDAQSFFFPKSKE